MSYLRWRYWLNRQLTWFLIVLAGCLALLVGWAIVLQLSEPIVTTFNVTAETERLTFRVTEDPIGRLVLKDAELELQRKNPECANKFTGSLQLHADSTNPLKVYIERVSSGPVWVSVEPLAADTRFSVATAFDAEDYKQCDIKGAFDAYINEPEVRASDGITTIIPLSGSVTLGRTVGVEVLGSTAILRSGEVRMMGRSAVIRSVYDAGSSTLSAGDRLEFSEEDVKAPVQGFVLIDERPAMTAAYRVDATSAQVTRPGGTELSIATSFFRRLLADWLFVTIGAIFSFVAILVQMIGAVLEIRRK